METCKSCKTEYDPGTKQIPVPVPDSMCAECGSQISKAQVAKLHQLQQSEESAA